MDNINIDDEWSKFLLNKDSDEDDIIEYDIDDESDDVNSKKNKDYTFLNDSVIPEATDIYISTKSKIAYLTQAIDLKIFWDIPIIPYATPTNGVIKKQIKFNSKTPEELYFIQEKLKKELYFEENIISHIDNPNGRIKFKDIRKISIGISKKDIMTYRSKKKQAFYNCFVMILRIKIDNVFREFHIKVFNTGKLEIPGVQSEAMFETVLNTIIEVLQPYHDYKIEYKQTSDTVLINSNFNCGFYVNRESLYDILRNKYNIQAIYDPCSYPGIQCKFYYNSELDVQTGIQTSTDNKEMNNIIGVSFMIFRTGSVLIVGMCDEKVLYSIYEFLKKLLKDEFKYICQKIIDTDYSVKDKKKKIRRKTINIVSCIDNNTTLKSVYMCNHSSSSSSNSSSNIQDVLVDNSVKNSIDDLVEEIIVKNSKRKLNQSKTK